jgi:mitochondrial fission protein ELM1
LFPLSGVATVVTQLGCAQITSQQTRDERLGEFMTKQIEIHGQRVQLFSLDQGRTWSSSPQSIVAYGQRQTVLRLELQKRFARIDEMQDPDPNNFTDFEIPMSFIGR